MALFRQRTATDVEDRIRSAIEGMRDLIPIEGMDIDLLEFDSESGTAVIKCSGDCPDCDLSAENLTVGIEAHSAPAIPEIRAIRFDAR